MSRRSVNEWIGKTPDSKVPDHVRDRIFEAHGRRCHISGRIIRPGEPWDLDHVKALINGGEHRESNLAPALRDKHREKTAEDVALKSRAYRKRKYTYGFKRAKGRPMPGSKASGLRKKMDGTVERRA